MLELIIVEGPRGTGKSTITRKLRDKIDGATLINPTGFKDDGEDGFNKIKRYYMALDSYLHHLAGLSEVYTVILDRTFFSEYVYSQIYKSYDFTTQYRYLLESMFSCADEIHLFYTRVSKEEVIKERLNRDKVQLFNQVEESVAQSTKQQQFYDELFEGMANNFINEGGDIAGTFTVINTDDLTVDQVYQNIMEVIRCQTDEEKTLM